MAEKLFVYDAKGDLDAENIFQGEFELQCCGDCGNEALGDDCHLVLWKSTGDDFDDLKAFLKAHDPKETAVVLLTEEISSEALSELHKHGLYDVVIGGGRFNDVLPRLVHALEIYKSQRDLATRALRANEMAFSAMVNTADLGACLQFFMKSVECDDFQELGKLFFETMNHFGIDCVLQIRSDFGTVNLVPKGELNPLEATLLGHLKDRGRFFDHNQRTFVNYESISLLIKNMPVDDEVKYGQIKDNILTVVEAVDMKTRELDNFQALCNEKELMKRMVNKVQVMVKGVDESFGKVIKDIAGVVENLVSETEDLIPQLMMNEEHERRLEKILKRGIDDTQKVFGDGLRVDEGFRDFLDEIGNVMSQTHISHAQMAELLERLRD